MSEIIIDGVNVTECEYYNSSLGLHKGEMGK